MSFTYVVSYYEFHIFCVLLWVSHILCPITRNNLSDSPSNVWSFISPHTNYAHQQGRIHVHSHRFIHSLSSTAVRFGPPQWGLTFLTRLHKTRSTRDRSIPRSVQRWVSTKSSISQLTFFHFRIHVAPFCCSKPIAYCTYHWNNLASYCICAVVPACGRVYERRLSTYVTRTWRHSAPRTIMFNFDLIICRDLSRWCSSAVLLLLLLLLLCLFAAHAIHASKARQYLDQI